MEGRWLHKEDRWKDRALYLQHRLRDRFRVVVDQHRCRQKSSGYVSSVMQRWIQRFRHFRSQTLANSSTFYRKRVSNEFDTEEDSVLTQILQAVVVPIIGNVCHVFMHGLNDVQVNGHNSHVCCENFFLHMLILDAENAPMVVPFVHGGMQEMMLIGATFSRVGKRVTILVGDPIDFKDVRDLEQGNMTPRGNLYDAVSERIGDRLIKLKAQLDNLVLDQDLDTEGYDCNYKQDNHEYFSYKGSGIVPSDLMGFAARGTKVKSSEIKGVANEPTIQSSFKSHSNFSLPPSSSPITPPCKSVDLKMEGRWLHKEDRWKDRALCLQHRLRDRFRVVVDQHRRRQRSSGYVSSVMQRWIQRFRHFRSQTLANSSTFYRKRVSNEFDTEEDSVLTQILQAVAVPIIGNVCHVFMHGLNDVQIYGGEKLQQALVKRPNKTPLITVSNHIASMDDPLVISALLPKSVLLDARNLRWTLCATDRCFRNPVTSAFFNCVKVLPVSRGEGIYQKGMDVAIRKLNRGGWVHIFAVGPVMVEQLLVLLKEVLQSSQFTL
ncbi:hypothetical protein LXL04_016223 [Taraxacum kok-saghyz]